MMRHIPSSLLAIFLFLPAAARPLPVEAPAASRIQADVDHLASPALKGRRAGTPEADAAADWIAARFAALGLRPAGAEGTWFQAFGFIDGVDLGPGNVLATTVGTATKSWKIGEDFRPLAFSAAGAVSGVVVFAGYGITAKDLSWDDYEGLDVKDKIVLVLRYFPEDADQKTRAILARYADLRYKAMQARQKGAKAMLVVTGPRSQNAGETIPMSFDTALAGSGIVAASLNRMPPG